MATVFDVAKYILFNCGPITTMKLQKLVYYAQAWHFVWNEEPLFKSRIEAWANGPVCPELYSAHRGWFEIDLSDLKKGSKDGLTEKQKDTIKRVIKFYGPRPAYWLVQLSHQEKPWLQARNGCPEGENCSNEITLQSMMEYYGNL